ncbi:HAD-like domain-containing protein [Aspergillus sergii]|uniref:HAD-like domain-containing protein n=1 Tax=Aspergillus sergii TaxID=1034303 RepID=A0A5N6XBD8_9EURO|nr:HAD-like domain-containing protein [Aspergillus sergii]
MVISISFPAIRACIFDMDGLLINSEDIITVSTNQLLEKYKRPPFDRTIRAQLMGIPDSTNGDTFHNWAKLPISREQFARELTENMRRHFPTCTPLPGAEMILSNLSQARNASSGARIGLALASGTKSHSYELKTSTLETKRLLDFFPPDRRVLGDDPRVRQGRGKPAPDIYLVALQSLNLAAAACGEKPILPHECLVFEDSVIGVEAGRRAGMRVVWVPHPDVAVEYYARQKEVLAGRVGIIEIGDEGQLGELDDDWAESIPTLEQFDYEKYGIEIDTTVNILRNSDDKSRDHVKSIDRN